MKPSPRPGPRPSPYNDDFDFKRSLGRVVPCRDLQVCAKFCRFLIIADSDSRAETSHECLFALCLKFGLECKFLSW